MTTQNLSHAIPIVFNFASKSLRVIMINDAPWFVAADVCAALELPNTTRAIERLDSDERQQVVDSATLNTNQGTGINDLLNVINESGLYSLILTSRKPEAKKFKKWVTSEVLPAIRKTGQYVTPEAALAQPDFANLMAVAHAWADMVQAQADMAQAQADAAQTHANKARAWVEQYAQDISSHTQTASPQPQTLLQQSQTLLPVRETAFIQAWWDCLGSQTVTSTDLYRAVATKQCQELNNSSSALLGEISQWTPKKLSHALRRWSQSVIVSYSVLNIGKSSHGLLWRLESLST